MLPVALSETVAVGEVPTVAEIEILAKAGFQSLLNNQPEGEVERHLTAAEAEVAAKAAGLAYRHLPVESRRPSEATVAAFAQALAFLPKPIYAFCYSGSRTAAAWALAAAAHMETDAILAACTDVGHDIAFLKPQIEERRARLKVGTGHAAAGSVAGVDAAAGNGGTPAAAAVSNGATHADNHAAGASVGAAAAVPELTPNILLPRAATAGGFAVSG